MAHFPIHFNSLVFADTVLATLGEGTFGKVVKVKDSAKCVVPFVFPSPQFGLSFVTLKSIGDGFE